MPTLTGVLSDHNVNASGWNDFKVDGKKVSTKKQSVVQQAQELLGQQVEADVTENPTSFVNKEGQTVNTVNRWLNSVVPARSVAAPDTAAAAEPGPVSPPPPAPALSSEQFLRRKHPKDEQGMNFATAFKAAVDMRNEEYAKVDSLDRLFALADVLYAGIRQRAEQTGQKNPEDIEF